MQGFFTDSYVQANRRHAGSAAGLSGSGIYLNLTEFMGPSAVLCASMTQGPEAALIAMEVLSVRDDYNIRCEEEGQRLIDR